MGVEVGVEVGVEADGVLLDVEDVVEELEEAVEAAIAFPAHAPCSLDTDDDEAGIVTRGGEGAAVVEGGPMRVGVTLTEALLGAADEGPLGTLVTDKGVVQVEEGTHPVVCCVAEGDKVDGTVKEPVSRAARLRRFVAQAPVFRGPVETSVGV